MGAVLPVASYSGDLNCQTGACQVCAAQPLHLADLASYGWLLNRLPPSLCSRPALQSLEGKVALVTGASTGIGRRLADKLVSAGMQVIGTSRTPEEYLNAGE